MKWVVLSCSLVFAVLFLDRTIFSADHRPAASKFEATVTKPDLLPERKAYASAVSGAPKGQEESETRSATGIRLSAENQTELQHCGLGSGSGVTTLDDVVKGLSQESGKAERRALIWRNVHFQAPDGEERRLRIWRDFSVGLRGKLRAQLYTLDEEGLPVPLEQQEDELEHPTLRGTEKYLEGSKVTRTQEKVSLTFGEPKHLSLSIETENGWVKSFEAKDDAMAFQCFTAPEADHADCKCLGQALSQ